MEPNPPQASKPLQNAPQAPKLDPALQKRLENFNKEFIELQKKYAIQLVCSMVYTPSGIGAVPTAIDREKKPEAKPPSIIIP